MKQEVADLVYKTFCGKEVNVLKKDGKLIRGTLIMFSNECDVLLRKTIEDKTFHQFIQGDCLSTIKDISIEKE